MIAELTISEKWSSDLAHFHPALDAAGGETLGLFISANIDTPCVWRARYPAMMGAESPDFHVLKMTGLSAAWKSPGRAGRNQALGWHKNPYLFPGFDI